MSAFVIDTAQMDRVLLGLFSRNQFGQNVPEFCGRYTEAGDRLSWDPTELGRALLATNVEAVTQRYPDCRAEPSNLPGTHDAADLPTTYRFNKANVGRRLTTPQLVDCFKATESLRYQCSEGNIPDTAMYAALTAAVGELARAIVHQLPDYRTANW
jgi:hypothetical protein